MILSMTKIFGKSVDKFSQELIIKLFLQYTRTYNKTVSHQTKVNLRNVGVSEDI